MIMAPSVANVAYYTLHLSIFIASNIYSFVDYMVWMTLLTPLRIWIPSLYWRIEKEFFYLLETVCVSWVTKGGYKVIECGDDINSLHDSHCLLLPNHQGSGDVPLVMLALHGKKMTVSKLMWVIFKLYKWTNFGIVCQHREDFFVDVGKALRNNQLVKFSNHLVDSYLKLGKNWIVIFPEGGFLCRNQESNKRYAVKNNLPDLNHVLLPRVGAVKTVLDSVGELYDEAADVNKTELHFSNGTQSTVDSPSSSSYHTTESNASLLERVTGNNDPRRPIKWIVDMTIAYKDKQPLELLGMSIGYDPRKDALVHWRAYRVKDIPREEEALTAWLYQRYIEKEEMLDAYYKENKMPSPPANSSLPPLQPRYFKFDVLYQLLVHATLITLFYLQYVLVCKPILAVVGFLLSPVFHLIF